MTRLADGTYLVSTYAEIASLLHDPRVSSDISRNPAAAAAGAAGGRGRRRRPGMTPTFLSMDPPDHDKFRRIAMRHFGPPTTPGRVAGMEPRMTEIVTDLIDNMAGRSRIDVVDDLAYPLPVTVICELLGVPPGTNSASGSGWTSPCNPPIPASIPKHSRRSGPKPGKELRAFMEELVEAHRQAPGDDLLSAMATDDGPEGRDAGRTAGEHRASAAHRRTRNHREPHRQRRTDPAPPPGTSSRRLRNDPDLAIPMVEELLRYEPPVHFVPFRTALDDIDIAGTTIPAGASFTLLLAAGNRDPAHVADPDLFIPDRPNNQHLGFGGGIHLCFGAPLARLEAQIALTEFASRLENPRLVADPPPYRPSPFLRGPSHLPVDIDGIAGREAPAAWKTMKRGPEDSRAPSSARSIR